MKKMIITMILSITIAFSSNNDSISAKFENIEELCDRVAQMGMVESFHKNIKNHEEIKSLFLEEKKSGLGMCTNTIGVQKFFSKKIDEKTKDEDICKSKPLKGLYTMNCGSETFFVVKFKNNQKYLIQSLNTFVDGAILGFDDK